MPTVHAHTSQSFQVLSQNDLLATLPADELERLHHHLELVPLPLGEVIYESGGKLSHLYFPTTAIISLLYVTEDGASAEISIVGNEGIIGVAVFMGGDTMPNMAVVQSAGYAYRLKAQLLQQEFNRSLPMRHLLLSFDRLPSNELIMTQELISNMLGVRREGITDAARKLQSAGLIEYRRGHITLLDRQGLEDNVCECYSVVKKEYDRLLPDRIAT
mgnify:CR=1 FL=1